MSADPVKDDIEAKIVAAAASEGRAQREANLKIEADKATTLADLIVLAQNAFAALTPDQQAHHRHEQRVSFAAGNVALSLREPPVDTLPGETLIDTARRLTRAAAGPCPCALCSAVTS